MPVKKTKKKKCAKLSKTLVTPKQKAARAKFATKARQAAKLVKSGKAKNMKAAWKQIK